MTTPVAPIVLAAIFVGGLLTIQTLHNWAAKITEGLIFVLATVTATVVSLFLAQTWPRFYANPDVPLITTIALSGDLNHNVHYPADHASRYEVEK